MMRVLAIDPGFDRMGIAVLEGDPSKPTLVWSDCFLPPKGAPEERLAYLHGEIAAALTRYTPDRVALETLFFSTNNKASALGVAEARGVVLSLAGLAGIAVHEYSPQTVKLAVTGYGNADKVAVSRMLPHLIELSPRKRLDDELDAIALGIAALTDRYPH